MDSTALNHISLCSGYGGIDLGLSRVLGDRVRTVAYSEIEAFACANLVAKMEAGLLDPAPIWTDLKTFPWEEFHGLVDILSGGYPCQPFSAAGKRAGKDDPRHLWPWIADGIAICRPRFCFFENVEGHVTLGLCDVIEDLGRMGYRTTWGVFSASEVGAPHQRKRVFILAERGGERDAPGLSGSLSWEEGLARIADYGGDEGRNELADPRHLFPGRRAEPATQAHADPSDRSEGMGDSFQQGMEGSHYNRSAPGRFQRDALESGQGVWPSRPGEPQHGWEPPRVVVDAKNRRQFSDDTPPAKVGRWSAESGLSNTEGTSNERRQLDNASGNGHGTDDSVSAGRESAVDAGVGNAEDTNDETGQSQGRGSDTPLVRSHNETFGQDEHRGAGRHSAPNTESLAQPPLGRDSHGTPNRLDHAELYVTCDNRTDELRLLGNGVVPATAERAFWVLMAELALP